VKTADVGAQGSANGECNVGAVQCKRRMLEHKAVQTENAMLGSAVQTAVVGAQGSANGEMGRLCDSHNL
jgi:hypothetical protein